MLHCWNVHFYDGDDVIIWFRKFMDFSQQLANKSAYDLQDVFRFLKIVAKLNGNSEKISSDVVRNLQIFLGEICCLIFC